MNTDEKSRDSLMALVLSQMTGHLEMIRDIKKARMADFVRFSHGTELSAAIKLAENALEILRLHQDGLLK